MEGLERVLSSQPFFEGMRQEHVATLAGCATNVRVDAGRFIFREGESAEHFYLLRHGHVALELHKPGSDPIIVQTLGEGDVLGASWFCEPFEWVFDAHALSLMRAIQIDAACLRRKCALDHELGYVLVERFSRVLIQRLQATRLQLMDVYGR